MQNETVELQTKKLSTKISAGIIMAFGLFVSIIMGMLSMLGAGTFSLEDWILVLGALSIPLIVSGSLAYIIIKKNSWKYILILLILSCFIPTDGFGALFNPLSLLFYFLS